VSGLRVVAVTDTDSYLKWGAATLDRLPAEWTTHVLVLRSPVAPTPSQQAGALAGTRFAASGVPGGVVDVTRWTLLRELERLAPDVLLVAATGPVADLVVRLVRRRDGLAPLIVTGLPGMSIPATELALRLRAGSDLFVAHSAREQRDFAALSAGLGLGMSVVRGRLPFLHVGAVAVGAPSGTTSTLLAGGALPTRPDPVRRVLFTPQAKMPVAAADRERILLALDALATSRPDIEVIVKLRALAGEAQTHREALPYDRLWARLVERGEVTAGAVALRTGPLGELLEPGTALVTVSSTAVLEALGARLPVLVLGDFGVDEANLTYAFADSGLIGSLDDLAAARFYSPDRAWLAENYFHDDDGLEAALVAAVVEQRAAGGSGPGAADRPGATPRMRLRTAVRTGLPLGLLRCTGKVSRALQKARKRARRRWRRWLRALRSASLSPSATRRDRVRFLAPGARNRTL